jgi:tetratricopeptide (TPR) repeat protein
LEESLMQRFRQDLQLAAGVGFRRHAFVALVTVGVFLCAGIAVPCAAGTLESPKAIGEGNSGTSVAAPANAVPDGGFDHRQKKPAPTGDAKALEIAIHDASELVADAQRLIEAGSLDRGEDRVREAIAVYDHLPATNAMVIFGHANCYVLLGMAANQRGDLQKAFKWWQQAVTAYEKLKAEPAVDNLVSTLKLMVEVLIKVSQNEDALSVFQKIDDVQEGANSAVRALNKNNIGVMLHRLGREREAEEQLKQAGILSESGASTAEEKARYLYNLGLTESELRHTKSAIEHYRQSLRYLEGVDHNEESRAEALAGLGQALIDDGEREAAARQFTAALRTIKQRPELRKLKAEILNGRARAMPEDTAAKKGEIVKTLRQALSLVAGQEGTEETQVTSIENLGLRLTQMGYLNETIRSYKEVLARLSQKPFKPTNDQLEDLYNNLGIYLLDGGRRSEALDSRLLGLNNAWAGMVGRLPTMTQKETLGAATDVARLANFIYSIALASPETTAPRAYEALLETKALYSEANRARQQSVFHAGPLAAGEARERYVELRHLISRRTLDSAHIEVAVSDEVLTEIASEADRLEHELIGAAKELSPDLDLSPVHARDVWSKLKPGELLIDYFKYENLDLRTRQGTGRRYGAFVLHAGGAIEAVDLGDANTVGNAVKAFRDCEAAQVAADVFNEDELAILGQSLRHLILDPVLATRDPLKRLYVAPDRVLGLFPFDALPTAKGPSGWRYLAEDVEVVHLLSGRELVRTSATRSTSNEVWLFGDPDFDATPNQRIAAFNNPSQFAGTPDPGEDGSDAKKGAVLMRRSPDSEGTGTAIPTNWQRVYSTEQIVDSAAQQAIKAGLKTRVLLGGGGFRREPLSSIVATAADVRDAWLLHEGNASRSPIWFAEF